jgi:Domain of unknown function (DUF4159)
MRKSLIFLLGIMVLLSSALADHGPPPAKPKRIKGGESFPPLPLPVTPLRRTERKREPAAPALIGKVMYGEPRIWTGADGQSFLINDWESEKGDLPTLLKRVATALGTRYRHEAIRLDTFSTNPDELPILYITGHGTLDLTPEQRVVLREYVVNGGTIIAVACHGTQHFTTAFLAEMAHVFPGKSMKPLPPDHPVFHSVYNIDHVAYASEVKGHEDGLPHLLGLNIGCRTAVFLSPLCMTCSWANVQHTKCPSWSSSDGAQMGVNLIAYALAYLPLGKYLSETKVYYESEERARGDFVFAQIRHGGDWDPDPSAAANLLRAVSSLTSATVKFKRVSVSLDQDLSEVPFLYLTGHEDFRFSEREAKNLRNFLESGGFLLADACCGRKAFDLAFRREIKRVLPESPLRPLKPNHPIFSCHLGIGEVEYTPLVKQERAGLHGPEMEGVEVDGALRVLYSHYDLGNGWEGIEHPFTRGLAAGDALKVGVNAITYAMTH